MLFTELKHNIKTALKQNTKPGLVLQLFAIIILVSYYSSSSVQQAFDQLGTLKKEYGLYYSFISTAIFGGLIPFIYLFATQQFKHVKSIFWIAVFYLVFWGYKGVEVDLLYQLQGQIFGYENNFKTIATKTAVDQFIYSALWAAPSIAVAYLWMENDFNIKEWKTGLNKAFFTVQLPTVIISNWLIWIPAVSVVYLMPAQLQVPLFNLVLCFWVLLLAVLNSKKA